MTDVTGLVPSMTDEEFDEFVQGIIDRVKAEIPISDDVHLAAYTRAVVEKVAKELATPDLQPGRVQTVNSDGTVMVLLDVNQDDEAAAFPVRPLVGEYLREDQRVMVLFWPPSAVFVIGVRDMNGPVVRVLDHVPTDADWPGTPPDGVEAVNSNTLRKYVRVDGVYRYSTLT